MLIVKQCCHGQCCRSMTFGMDSDPRILTNGSGSCYLDPEDANKKLIFKFFCLFRVEGTLHLHHLQDKK
jgi:hypothetical protein